MSDSRLALLVQLPIPPPGPGMVEGNQPLAAAYLKLFARRQALGNRYDIEVFPAALANTLGDQALVHAILARQPCLVSFTCYLWNVERTLWIAERLRASRPDLKIVLGGPEITVDNQWVLQNPAVDYAVFGEGEATFAGLMSTLAAESEPTHPIPGLWRRNGQTPPQRTPLADLDAISSPYVENILDLSESRQMLLETARGCRFCCKYCYYPKGNARPRMLSREQISANLRYAVERGAEEVFLLDPTLNQRPDFVEFIELLRLGNADGRLRFSGELRAEGIDPPTARLLRQAGFHEVEIGLQSVEPEAWRLMGRPTDLAEFERGVQALIAEGVEVRTDLILGLPGDTADSIRRGIDYLQQRRLYTQAQVFNLSILPGTAFRRQAEQLGLKYQPWPPYYVLRTPTLDVEVLCQLMEEAQEAFGAEFDPLPPPTLDPAEIAADSTRGCLIDLDAQTTGAGGTSAPQSPLHASPGLCFTLWLKSADFHAQRRKAVAIVEKLLGENPHTTLQIVLEPTGDPARVTVDAMELLMAACYRNPTYLDRYYSLHPGRLLGSKRLFVLLSRESRRRVDDAWRQGVSDYATIVE